MGHRGDVRGALRRRERKGPAVLCGGALAGRCDVAPLLAVVFFRDGHSTTARPLSVSLPLRTRERLRRRALGRSAGGAALSGAFGGAEGPGGVRQLLRAVVQRFLRLLRNARRRPQSLAPPLGGETPRSLRRGVDPRALRRLAAPTLLPPELVRAARDQKVFRERRRLHPLLASPTGPLQPPQPPRPRLLPLRRPPRRHARKRPRLVLAAALPPRDLKTKNPGPE
mmetsp:Transcript_779/g.2225  ORF Transcript_779/g.2225 Transcript_779/m.2225 type:complete len:225 (+) Transcript_779:482-1156(+)